MGVTRRRGRIFVWPLVMLALETAAAAAEPRVVSAVRRSAGIEIDGALDESAWGSALASSGFWQRAPREGSRPEHDTEFRVLYDDAALYIAVHAYDSTPGSIIGLVTRRDQASSSDWIEVSIDSYRDRRTSFVFGLNPAGVQRDWIVFDDVNMDLSWDAVWVSAARVTPDGWTAEMRIPFNELRFSRADDGKLSWGVQLRRVVGRSNEETVWSPWPRDNPYPARHYGTLEGISGIPPRRRLALVPYGMASLSVLEEGPNSPLRDRVEPDWHIGIDGKYGLSSNITLAATVNPDFGQVEADPSEINLTAYETFFSEKRPFFLEGTDVFQFGLGQSDSATETLFYSRRIGATPRQPLTDGAFQDVPEATRIYGAAKITGKTRSGWTVGLLNAVTAEEDAVVVDAAGERTEEIVAPLANHAVVRLKKDANEGRTLFGAAATSAHRALDGTGLESELHDQAYTGGLQLEHRFWDATWSANVRAVGSYVHGSAAAITQTQRASQRYFQRPDADYLTYDEMRTSLSGGALLWSIGKDAGGNVRLGVGADLRSPGLELNDLGFQQFADNLNEWIWLQYHDEEVSDSIHAYEVNFVGWSDLDWGLGYKGSAGNLNGRLTLSSYWHLAAGLKVFENRWLPGQLRGGPSIRGDLSYDSSLEIGTDARRAVAGTLKGQLVQIPASRSWALRLAPGLRVLARSNLELSLEPTLTLRAIDDQYVDTATDMAGASDYLTARLQQTTLSATLRVNYAFRPTLTLQLYVEPFLSSGQYARYKRVADPRAGLYSDRYQRFEGGQLARNGDQYDVDRDLDGVVDYSFDAQDFDFRQFRSSMVMRWQYRPGSTLFAVWSHERSSQTSDGSFALGEELSGLAAAAGEHVFLLKLNWWLDL